MRKEDVFEDAFYYHACKKIFDQDYIVTLKKAFGKTKRSFYLSKATGIWERPYFRIEAESMVDPLKKYTFTNVRHVPDFFWKALISNSFSQRYSGEPKI